MKIRKLFLPLVLMLSTLMVAYAPMASFSHAQVVNDSKLQEMKDKAASELQRRIDNYKKTLKSLETNVSVEQGKSSVGISSDKGSATGEVTHFCDKEKTATPSPKDDADGSLSFTLGKDGLKGLVALPCGFKDKTKQFLEAVLGGLTGMLDKVKNVQSMTEMTALGKNIDAQFGMNQLTQVQAMVTQAVESMTGVLENLKASYNGLQGQVTAIKECTKNLKAGETTVQGDVTANGAQVSCGDFNLSSADVGKQAQGQLDSLSTVITTISSVLASSVGLLMSLFTSFSGLAGSLGSLGSLANLGNLGSLLGGGGGLDSLSSLTGSLGSITGIMSSFSAITSQLDIANFMSGNAMGNLSGLSSLINLPV